MLKDCLVQETFTTEGAALTTGDEDLTKDLFTEVEALILFHHDCFGRDRDHHVRDEADEGA